MIRLSPAKQQQKIVEALAGIDHPERQYHGLTDEEISERTGLDLKLVRARVLQLVRQDLVRDTWGKRPSKSTKSTTVWALSPKALHLFKKEGKV